MTGLTLMATADTTTLAARKVLDKRAMCAALGIGERTLWRLVKRGEIPKPFKLGVRCVWLTKLVDRHLERLQTRAG